MNLWIFASQNRHKCAELAPLLQARGIQLKPFSLKDASLSWDKVEGEESFSKNALLKAKAVWEKTGGGIILSEDSGLCVEALNGAPGVISSRYSEPIPGITQDEANREKLRKLIDRLPSKTSKAYFLSEMVLYQGESLSFLSARGKLHGIVTACERGKGGFGYDCLFIPENETRSLGEMSLQEKNLISHRKKALESLLLQV